MPKKLSDCRGAAQVRKRLLGKTGLLVSEIGFGGWGIGKGSWKGGRDQESLKALKVALDCGINYFDTALAYGNGHSERLIGRVARESKADIVISTKIPPKAECRGLTAVPALSRAFPPSWIERCVESSLRNLGTDGVAMEKLHFWTDAWLKDPLWPEVMETFSRLKKQGKVRFIGVSVPNGAWRLASGLIKSGAIDVLQTPLNVFEPGAAEDIFSSCQEKRIGVVARSPLDGGALAGELTPRTSFEPGDFRGRYFGGVVLLDAWRRAERLKAHLDSLRAESLAQAALRFCLSFPAVSSVIPGMRRVAHVKQNAAVSDGHYYTEKELRVLQEHRWHRSWV